MAIIVTKERPRSYKKSYTLVFDAKYRNMGVTNAQRFIDDEVEYNIKLKRIPSEAECVVTDKDGDLTYKWVWYETEVDS